MPEERDSIAHLEFVNQIRRALHGLYDPSRLGQSSLADLLDIHPPGPTGLRDALIRAIDETKPATRAQLDGHAWRSYRALYHRFVEQFSQQEVATTLGLSVRQLRREEKRAISVLADNLWLRYGLDDSAISDWLPSESGLKPERLPEREDELLWLAESSPTELADIGCILDEVVPLVRCLADPLQVSVLVVVGDLSPVRIRQTSMRQALLSILTTAVRSVPGGKVQVELSRESDSVHVNIQSLSVGQTARMSPGEYAKEADLVEKLVELSGGRLYTKDEPDSCCPYAVSIQFPAALRETVLVIDDNADTLGLFERYLVGTPYAFHGTRDPLEAIETATRIRPVLIILDVMLPGIDGWELLQRLREHPALLGIPVLVCSILLEEHLALALGAAGFLPKPVTRAAFLDQVEAHLDAAQRGG